MRKYLVIATEQEQGTLKRINDMLLPTITDGITDNYDIPLRLNGNSAIEIKEGFEWLFTEEEISNTVELGTEWFPITNLSTIDGSKKENKNFIPAWKKN